MTPFELIQLLIYLVFSVSYVVSASWESLMELHRTSQFKGFIVLVSLILFSPLLASFSLAVLLANKLKKSLNA